MHTLTQSMVEMAKKLQICFRLTATQHKKIISRVLQFPWVHSFIHYGDLYSISSRLLLRSAHDPCTAKKKSFEARIECVRKNHG